MNVGEATEDPDQLKIESKYLHHPLLQAKAIEGRPYQALIFSNVVKHNSLIVAPTGIGKTVLFLLATIHTLQNSSGFVIIVAPTLTLIEQHVNFFREKTTFKPQQILPVTGKLPPKRRKQIWAQNVPVFVCTPETLVNDLRGGFVKLANCRLLVIDEAHRGTQDKYQQIMAAVRHVRAAGSPLRILAASATIPEPKLLKIMGTLDLEHIEIRTASDPELAPYVVKAQVEQRIIPLPESWHQVMAELQSLRTAALRGINRYKTLMGREIHNRSSRSALLAALEHVKQLPPKVDAKSRANLSTRLAAAIKLDHAWDLFSRHGKTAFLDYAQKLYNERSKANKRLVSSPQFQHALEIVTALDQEHPKIRELHRILENEPAKTVMIFSKSKSAVFRLATILRDQGIPTDVLVGKKELSEEKRKMILQNFQNGHIRVLVSTNVGEEGLDIGCDLVIFFDTTASVIRHVQRKGRLRTPGKVIFLIAKDTLDEVFYYISTGEEKKMQEAFERLKPSLGGSNIPNLTQNKITTEQRQTKNVESPEEVKKTPPSTRHEDPMERPVLIKVDPRDSDLTPTRIPESSLEIVALGGPSFVIDQIAVFRFSFPDFLQDLSGGTLLPKLIHAAKTHQQCVVILEGDYSLDLLNTVKIHKKMVLRTIWAIVLDLGLSLIPSDSVTETKHLLEMLIERQSTIKDPSGLKNRQEALVATLPGVSSLLAKRLLATYFTPLNVFSLDEAQLQMTQGIGTRKSRSIFRLLNTPYEDSDG